MAKKYVNGYDKFRFRMREPDGTTHILNFSFKYEAMAEYYEVISDLHKFTDGSKKRLVHFVEYEWRIFWTDYIELEDMMKLKQLEDWAIAGFDIFLTPHKDKPCREFKVLILDEKREISAYPSFRDPNLGVNYGFEISFINADPIYEIQTIDPGDIIYSGSTILSPMEGQVIES